MKSDKKTLVSPNHMLWQYYSLLKRLVQQTISNSDTDEKRQGVALCIVFSVTLVEAFINIFFSVVVGEPGFEKFKEKIIKDLDKRRSLKQKISSWPKLVFGKSIDFENGIGFEFNQLNETRNWLMHFKSSYETISAQGIFIQGLADTSKYEELNNGDAIRAIKTAEDIIGEIVWKRLKVK